MKVRILKRMKLKKENKIVNAGEIIDLTENRIKEIKNKLQGYIIEIPDVKPAAEKVAEKKSYTKVEQVKKATKATAVKKKE